MASIRRRLSPAYHDRPYQNGGANDEGSGDRVVKREDMVVDVRLGVETQTGAKDGLEFVPRKQLIVVTPTYNRPLQASFLNRLGQVLRLLPPPLLWIVVEMNSASTLPIPYLIALCALRLLASKPKEGRDRAQRQAEGKKDRRAHLNLSAKKGEKRDQNRGKG